MVWAQEQRRLSKMSMRHLRQRIDELNKLPPTNETLEELIITNIHLNLEVNK